MLNAIALLLASSNSVKFQMLPHENIEGNYRIVVSPLLNDKTLEIPTSKLTTESGKTAAQVKNALITPFTITGTIEELSINLPLALGQISESRIEAKNNLDSLMKSLNTASSIKPKSTKKVAAKQVAKVEPTVAKTEVKPTALLTNSDVDKPTQAETSVQSNTVQNSAIASQVTTKKVIVEKAIDTAQQVTLF
jgi:hypothetical protein